MKALVLTDYKVLEYITVDEPSLKEKDVLVKIKACGICGSDVHGFDGSTGRRVPPIIMGHEASGVIVSKGSSVQNWNIGDRVTFDSNIYCKNCDYCLMGITNLCNNRRIIGVSCQEYRQQGAMAEFIAIPEHVLYRLPDPLSYEQACLVEPLAIAFHGINLTPVKINDVAVVIGAGTIGLLAIQALRLSGCGNIIAIDIDNKKFELARSIGADHSISAYDDDLIEKIQSISSSDGADIVVDAVGINSSVDMAVAAIKKGGHITLIGNLTPTITFPLQQIVSKELSVQGSNVSRGEYQACLEMIARNAIKIDFLISAVEPLQDGQKWFDKLYEGNSDLLKVVLQP